MGTITKSGQISKDRARVKRDSHWVYIFKVMDSLDRPMVAADLVDLDVSVARRELQELTLANRITARPDHNSNGTMHYTRMPSTQLTKRWRKREIQTDSTPRYY